VSVVNALSESLKVWVRRGGKQYYMDFARGNTVTKLKTEGATSVGNTPKEFTAFVREDIERGAPVVKASGAKPN